VASAQDVVFGSNRRSLNGTIYASAPGGAGGRALLFVHGLGSERASYQRRATTVCDRLAIHCLTFDLSGHGLDSANAKRYSVYDHLEDTIAAYDFLETAVAGAPARIGACGASYGAYLAVLLSARRPVRGLALRAPAVAADVTFPDLDVAAAREHLVGVPPRLDSLGILSGFDGPVAIIESECDERIPHSQIQDHVDACPHAVHEVIPGARHPLTDPAWDSVFIEAIIRWACDV
jgi:uncharacterized protein